MAEFYSYEELVNGGTFLLNSTTANAIKDNPADIVGKVVTLVDNYTVGYGSSGAIPLGFVGQVENENTNSNKLVVSVLWNVSHEDVPCAGSETAGSFAVCDGSGGLAVASGTGAATFTNTRLYGVDATNKVCTAYIHG